MEVMESSPVVHLSADMTNSYKIFEEGMFCVCYNSKIMEPSPACANVTYSYKIFEEFFLV